MLELNAINKENHNDICCSNCKHFINGETYRRGCVVMVCGNENSKHYQQKRYYYHRCKDFEWEDRKMAIKK